MNDDYLWDKTGEPDAEIEELEELLGELRYRRPAGELPLPARTAVGPRARLFTLPLAIAASVLFMLTAAGIWLALGNGGQKETVGLSAINIQTASAVSQLSPQNLALVIENLRAAGEAAPGQALVTTAGLRERSGPRRAPAFKPRAAAIVGAQLANLSAPKRRERTREDDEGIAARDQLIQALRLASSKLNLVQKKVQDNKGQSLGPVS